VRVDNHSDDYHLQAETDGNRIVHLLTEVLLASINIFQ